MVLFAACKEVQPLPALAREMEDVSVELKGSSALEYARELNLCAKQKTPEQCYGVDANQVQILIAKGIHISACIMHSIKHVSCMHI